MNETTATFEELLERDGRLVYTNRGVSMMPLLRQGRDLMIIEKKGPQRCKNLEAVLFRRPGPEGAYVLHRILKVNEDGTYWIVGDNCISGETVAEGQILGILTGVIRDTKPLNFSSLPYRLYVNTWCRWYPVRFFLLRMRGYLGACKRKLLSIIQGS